MTLHKFLIGQAVDFNSRLPSMSRPSGPFEVMSVLPVDEANSPTYRVKSEAEPFARVIDIGVVPAWLATPSSVTFCQEIPCRSSTAPMTEPSRSKTGPCSMCSST
jgi:hypothetical protein